MKTARICAPSRIGVRSFGFALRIDASEDPEGLICLALADGRGKIPSEGGPETEAFLMERLDLYREILSRPHVTGKDLIDAGIKPSTGFSEYLAYAHKLRLAGINRENALKQTLSMIRKQENASFCQKPSPSNISKIENEAQIPGSCYTDSRS